MTIKVLVVDDSAVMRGLLTRLLSVAPEIEVVGSAADPFKAREAIKKLNPDVVTLDVEMPGMDGIAFLEKIMTLRPMPVVMVSTLTHQGTETTIRALSIGAVECVGKPAMEGGNSDLQAFSEELIAKVMLASQAKVTTRSAPPASIAPQADIDHATLKQRIIGIGSSTGGVQALHEILPLLPAKIPAIVIVQHIQDNFVTPFVERLGKICAFPVIEVTRDMALEAGKAYVASGGMHMEIHRRAHEYIAKRNGSERVSGHLPSVDVMLRTMATAAGKNGIGVILTGMGKDGAQGLLAMQKEGAVTLGQNASSCVVYGMPKSAKELGAVQKELPLQSIVPELIRVLTNETS